jgi:Holliday junction resolvase RusA-like endonuclease
MKPSSYRFRLDIEPMPTPRPRVARFGVYYPKKYEQYKKALEEAVRVHWTSGPLPGLLCVAIEAVCKRPKTTKLLAPRGDWDNYAKGVCDAMNGVAYTDDTQIIEGACRRVWAQPGQPGYIDVEIRHGEPGLCLPGSWALRFLRQP